MCLLGVAVTGYFATRLSVVLIHGTYKGHSRQDLREVEPSLGAWKPQVCRLTEARLTPAHIFGVPL